MTLHFAPMLLLLSGVGLVLAAGAQLSYYRYLGAKPPKSHGLFLMPDLAAIPKENLDKVDWKKLTFTPFGGSCPEHRQYSNEVATVLDVKGNQLDLGRLLHLLLALVRLPVDASATGLSLSQYMELQGDVDVSLLYLNEAYELRLSEYLLDEEIWKTTTKNTLMRRSSTDARSRPEPFAHRGRLADRRGGRTTAERSARTVGVRLHAGPAPEARRTGRRP